MTAHAKTLQDKVAIVTGGNSGIGKAIVLALAEQGANIVIDYVAHPEATEELEKQVAALGGPGHRGGRRRQQGRRPANARRHGGEAFGRLDIMVNNAGVETRTIGARHHRGTVRARCSNINLKSAFFGTQIAAKQMIAQGGGGRIINITSVHEDWPMPGNTAVLPVQGRHADADPHRRRRARTPRHHGRRRRARCGGHADQHRHRGRPGGDEALDEAIPLGRMAEPDEIGSVVAFLAGDAPATSTAPRSSSTAA